VRPWRILALPPLETDVLRLLVAGLGEAVELTVPATRDRSGLHAALADAEIVIGDFTGVLAMDAGAVAAAPALAFLQMPSVGVDSCDLPALTAAGVPVANAAGFNARTVAEWALGAALTLCRRLAWSDRRVRAGQWPQAEILSAALPELRSLKVGILGFGHIGSETAGLFSALDCEVSYWTRTPRSASPYPYRDLDSLLSTADILVIALPLTPETTGLLGPERLALLPEGALVVNVARGGIVDEKALVEALDEGRVGGAAMDVFAAEPLPPDSPLRSHEGILLSPHVAGTTRQSQRNLFAAVTRNLTAAVTGAPVDNVVNGLSPHITRHPH
jgi:D-3-phosphoglycerate dehydrogenase